MPRRTNANANTRLSTKTQSLAQLGLVRNEYGNKRKVKNKRKGENKKSSSRMHELGRMAVNEKHKSQIVRMPMIKAREKNAML